MNLAVIYSEFSDIFCNLEIRTQLHGEELVVSNQQEPKFPSDLFPDTIEIPETDTSPAKTWTVLQGARLTIQIERIDVDVVTSGAVGMCGRTSESDGGMSVSE